MTVGSILRPAAWAEVESKIRTVPEYADLGSVVVRPERVAPNWLRPLCRYVRTRRLAEIQKLVAAFDRQTIPLFEGVRIGRPESEEFLLPPPIVEIHRNQPVIIDGLHRVFECLKSGRPEVVVALLHGSLPDLPADVLVWSDVELTGKKLPRGEKFQNFNPANFRSIKHFIDQSDYGTETTGSPSADNH